MARKKGATMTDAQRAAKGLKLAEKHANTALSAISRLSKTGAKYDFSPAVQDKIFGAINGSLKRCVDSFSGKKTEAEGLSLT